MGQEYTYYGVEVEPFFDDKLYYYLADRDYNMNEYVIVPLEKSSCWALSVRSSIVRLRMRLIRRKKRKKLSARLRMMKSVENQSREKKLTIPMTADGQGKHRHILISMGSWRRSARWN